MREGDPTDGGPGSISPFRFPIDGLNGFRHESMTVPPACITTESTLSGSQRRTHFAHALVARQVVVRGRESADLTLVLKGQGDKLYLRCCLAFHTYTRFQWPSSGRRPYMVFAAPRRPASLPLPRRPARSQRRGESQADRASWTERSQSPGEHSDHSPEWGGPPSQSRGGHWLGGRKNGLGWQR